MNSVLVPILALAACGGTVRSNDIPEGVSSTAGAATSNVEPGGEGSSSGIKLDVGGDTDAPVPVDQCKVVDDMNAVGQCTYKALPNSFDPQIQWTWSEPSQDYGSVVIPLVINLTDDNGDGAVDLCDIPDIIVVAMPTPDMAGWRPGHIYVLDGATGSLHFRVDFDVDGTTTPAVGDIDNDGLPEIVTLSYDQRLVAIAHDGSIKWEGADSLYLSFASVALANLDASGFAEIILGSQVFDALGNKLWTAPNPWPGDRGTLAADLDGDGKLEVVLGQAAYHHDGTPYYEHPTIRYGYPQVANLDDDPEPEILVTNIDGISLLEHDGVIKYSNLRPTGVPAFGNNWERPATIHDFDGDGRAEFAVSSGSQYTVYRADASIIWSAPVSAETGLTPGGTAFDFLGSGTAEAMYADEHRMFTFDEMGSVLLDIPRTSNTAIEYPVVADVDNDGSAEIVIVSSWSQNMMTPMPSPTVQVIRDVEDRWIQARRIWNQHTYHVTNVREDGTIPEVEPRHWEDLNTFRTNVQIENGALCIPPVE